MQKLIILDRDGVINQDSDNYIKTVDEFVPIPGSLEAIARLCQSDYTVVVATNQSGISRKLFSLQTLEAMHDKLQNLLEPLGGVIDRFYYCPHGPDELCDCRKPKPGMILKIINDFKEKSVPNELNRTYVVGDSLRDLQAGMAAGTEVALVKTGKGMRSLKKIRQDKLSKFLHVPVYSDLNDFTRQLLHQVEKNSIHKKQGN